jgi:hypothetical protein
MTIWYVEAFDAYDDPGIETLRGPYKNYEKAVKKAVKLVRNHDYCQIYPHTDEGFGEPIGVKVETERIFNEFPRHHNIHRVSVGDKIVSEEEDVEYGCGWPDNYYVKWNYSGNSYIQLSDGSSGELIKRDPNAPRIAGSMW